MPKKELSGVGQGAKMGETARHPFSYTLGPGPYRLVGFFDLGACLAALNAGNVNGYNNGLAMAPKCGVGSCAHCGRGILDNYIVETGEGKRFAVGSDCITKMAGEGQFLNLSEFERKVRLEKRRKGQEQRERRREKLAAEIKATIDANAERLKALPHPSKYHKAKSAYDYCLFCYRQGRITLGAIKYLKNAMKQWGLE